MSRGVQFLEPCCAIEEPGAQAPRRGLAEPGAGTGQAQAPTSLLTSPCFQEGTMPSWKQGFRIEGGATLANGFSRSRSWTRSMVIPRRSCAHETSSAHIVVDPCGHHLHRYPRDDVRADRWHRSGRPRLRPVCAGDCSTAVRSGISWQIRRATWSAASIGYLEDEQPIGDGRARYMARRLEAGALPLRRCCSEP